MNQLAHWRLRGFTIHTHDTDLHKSPSTYTITTHTHHTLILYTSHTSPVPPLTQHTSHLSHTSYITYIYICMYHSFFTSYTPHTHTPSQSPLPEKPVGMVESCHDDVSYDDSGISDVTSSSGQSAGHMAGHVTDQVTGLESPTDETSASEKWALVSYT